MYFVFFKFLFGQTSKYLELYQYSKEKKILSVSRLIEADLQSSTLSLFLLVWV